MALLAFANSFLSLTSWAISFFSLANSLVSLANCWFMTHPLVDLQPVLKPHAKLELRVHLKIPWNPCLFLSSFHLRLRHHFRHFFRQFIFSDMMIFQIDMVQCKGERFQRLLPYRRLQFAFPYHDGMPSHFSQPVQHLMVPLPVPPDLLHPEPGVRFRHHIILTPLMSVPEAPVHQNTGAIFLSTMSGLPGNRGWLSRYLNPLLHRNFLTRISGLVSLPLIAAILLWRCSMVKRSDIFNLQKHLSSNLISLQAICSSIWKNSAVCGTFSRIHCKTKNRQQVADDFKLLVPNSTSVNYIVPIPWSLR